MALYVFCLKLMSHKTPPLENFSPAPRGAAKEQLLYKRPREPDISVEAIQDVSVWKPPKNR